VAGRERWTSVVADELAAVGSGRAELRRFGLTMAVALVAFGALFLWRGRGGAVCLLAGGALFLLAALAVPRALRPIQRGWMAFAIALGWVMTRVILVALFYAGITPIALVARLVGKRFLALGFEPERETYWERRPPPTEGRERYERQF